MKINICNYDVITRGEISIHDFIFNELKFDYEKKMINIILLDPKVQEKSVMIVYHNVLGFDMVSSDFWGKSLHILDWEVAEDKEKNLTQKIMEEKEKYNYSNSFIPSYIISDSCCGGY